MEPDLSKEEIDYLIVELSNQLKDLESKRKDILGKIENLEIQRKAHAISKETPGPKQDNSIAGISAFSHRVSLFRRLFKGREDLYALRWESAKTGKSGYQPVCKNDWIRGICRKPQIKCGECPAREFMPLSDETIQRHLFGFERDARRIRKDFVVGVYPLLQDETCWFLAVDFDKES